MPTDILYGNNYATLTVDPTSNLTSINRACNGGQGTGQGSGNGGAYNAVDGFGGSGGSVSTSAFPSSTLKAAALAALDDITQDENEMRDDRSAVVKISEILVADVTNPDVYTERIKSILYMQMHRALNNAYRYGAMINSENLENGVNDTVEDVVAVLNQYLQGYDPNDTNTYALKFRYTLDKTHIYRVGGYYDEAMALLNSPGSWTFNNRHTMRAGYWQCVCQAEKDYFDETLPVEEFINQTELCKQQYAGYTYKSAIAKNPNPGGTVNNQIRVTELYPQPTGGILNLIIEPAQTGEVEYEITDLAGRTVKKSIVSCSGNEMTFDVGELTTGAYFINLHFTGGNKVVRFVKK